MSLATNLKRPAIAAGFVLMLAAIGVGIWIAVLVLHREDRPPFSNHYGRNLISSTRDGWEQTIYARQSRDGRMVLIDVPDNVVFVIDPGPGNQHWQPMFGFQGADVVCTLPDRQLTRIPWRRHTLVLLSGAGQYRDFPLPAGTAKRLYQPGSAEYPNNVIVELPQLVLESNRGTTQSSGGNRTDGPKEVH